MKLTTFAAVTATERQLGSQTINLIGHISVDGQPDVRLDNAFSASNGAIFQAVAAVEKPLAVLMNSGFEKLSVKGIEVEEKSSDSKSSGTQKRLWVGESEVRSGERLEV